MHGIERGRLRLVGALARRRGAGGRHGPRRLPVLARVEPHRTGRRRVLDGRSRPLPEAGGRLPRAWHSARRHPPSLHRAPLVRSPWRVRVDRGRLALRPFRRADNRPPRRPRGHGLHPQRAQRDGTAGLSHGPVPTRAERGLRGPRPGGRAPHRLSSRRRRGITGRARRLPGGHLPVDDGVLRRAGRRGHVCCRPRVHGGRMAPPAGRRRLRRRAGLHAGPDGARGPHRGDGRPAVDPDGLRVLARGGRARRAPGGRGHWSSRST